MTVMVIVLCLLIQRFYVLPVTKPKLNWFLTCYQRIHQSSSVSKWFGEQAEVLVLFAAAMLAYVIVVGLLTHILGEAFSFLCALVVLWYYLDAKPAAGDTEHAPLAELFMQRYQTVFGVLFWFILLGPLGALLYAELRGFEHYLQQQAKQEVYFNTDLLKKVRWVRSVADWVPVRLLGLTYALVGHFRPAFGYWSREISGLEVEPTRVVDYGMVALSWNTEHLSLGAAQEVRELESLVNRALIVWLVVISIYTIGKLL